MMGSGRKTSIVLLGLLLSLGACTEPVVVIDEPAEVETCEWLIPVGIELVNDYFYTLQETDLGPSEGDQARVPVAVLALNARGADLDARAAELECDLDQLNQAIVAATAGLESSDPVVRVFLETVRAGVVGAGDTPIGSWAFVGGADGGASIEPVDGWPITLTIDEESASGSAGCNGYYWPLTLERGEWAWAPGAATITELMCLDDNGEALQNVAEIERRYSDAFGQVAGYSLDGDALTLTGPEVELRYTRQDDELGSAGS